MSTKITFLFLLFIGVTNAQDSNIIIPLENTTIEMIKVPAGSFMMGSPENEPHRNQDEIQHKVTITNDYWLGKTQITVGQWQDIMKVNLRGQVALILANDTLYDFGENKRTIRDFMAMSKDASPETYLANEGIDQPMYFVSWNDAILFCNKLTEIEKTAGKLPKDYEYSLPTEAQWEFACRAGTTTATYIGEMTQDAQGNSPQIDKISWYSGTSFKNYPGKKLNGSTAGPRKVGQKEPNAWGFHDMLGNLWEWCFDSYEAYTTESVINPIEKTKSIHKVNRGGSFGSWANSERSAARAQNPSAEASAYRGFRVALTKKH